MKILVADDSPAFRAALTRRLVEAGYEVVKARDGVEALSEFYAERPDIVLLDLLMPRLSGWVACRIMKEDPVLGRTPVLAITAADGADSRYWAEHSGADAFVAKDEVGETLLDRIRAIVASRALADLAGEGTGFLGEDLGDVDVLARVCEMLDRKLFEATVVNDITAIAGATLDLHGSISRMLQALRRIVAFDAAAVGLVDEGIVGIWTPRRLPPSLVAGVHDRVVGHLDDATGATSSYTQWVAFESDRLLDAGEWRSEHVVRLTSHGRSIGVLALAAAHVDAFDDRTHRILRTMAPAMVTVLDSARLHQRSVAASQGV
ncbi:MAG: response regulator [Acidimicrobiia bacterium]|nr:response regulator [Acidimicrobiia bacterium]